MGLSCVLLNAPIPERLHMKYAPERSPKNQINLVAASNRGLVCRVWGLGYTAYGIRFGISDHGLGLKIWRVWKVEGAWYTGKC